VKKGTAARGLGSDPLGRGAEHWDRGDGGSTRQPVTTLAGGGTKTVLQITLLTNVDSLSTRLNPEARKSGRQRSESNWYAGAGAIDQFCCLY
jgi:hypothetical protein